MVKSRRRTLVTVSHPHKDSFGTGHCCVHAPHKDDRLWRRWRGQRTKLRMPGAIAQTRPLAVDARHDGVRRASLFAFVAVGVAVALPGEITGRGQGILGG